MMWPDWWKGSCAAHPMCGSWRQVGHHCTLRASTFITCHRAGCPAYRHSSMLRGCLRILEVELLVKLAAASSIVADTCDAIVNQELGYEVRRRRARRWASKGQVLTITTMSQEWTMSPCPRSRGQLALEVPVYPDPGHREAAPDHGRQQPVLQQMGRRLRRRDKKLAQQQHEHGDRRSAQRDMHAKRRPAQRRRDDHAGQQRSLARRDGDQNCDGGDAYQRAENAVRDQVRAGRHLAVEHHEYGECRPVWVPETEPRAGQAGGGDGEAGAQ